MVKLCDGDGRQAIIGESSGYWLNDDDFVSTASDFSVRCLGTLGFPRDWPACYSQNKTLKLLVGKKGRCAPKRVAVVAVPSAEDRAAVPADLSFQPLQSFANAERAEKVAGMSVIRGWIVFEQLDRPVGETFVAERYWWNALPGGKWVDFTPRPEAWPEVLLAENAGASKGRARLTDAEAELAAKLLRQRFSISVDLSLARAPKEVSTPASPSSPSATKAARPATEEAKKSSSMPVKLAAKQAAAPREAEVASRTVPTPKQLPKAAAEPPKKKGLDYSKFDAIEDSDDEAIVPAAQPISLPIGMPREKVTRDDYDKVFRMLFEQKDLPFIPAPDLDQMWGYYKYGGLDEQALLDQACEFIGRFPLRLTENDWKSKAYGLTRKLDNESREDEARVWCVIAMSRFPSDSDSYYNHGVLLSKQCDKAKFGGSPTTRLPSLHGPAKAVPTEQYCALFSKASASSYRRCLQKDPKSRAGYINLIGCLERNEPKGWYDEVHQLGVQAVKHGIWFNMWQRPPHFCSRLSAKPWHDPMDFAMCRALEENYSTIRDEYAAYIDKLVNRKDWDDSDTTPGLGDVGGREGALHDGGLAKSGKWREVPMFTNGTMQREYTSLFPETTKILTTHCRDATGLAFCVGGDVIFSVISPGTRLRPHCGPSNSRLTCHLGITIPRTLEQGCKIRVANEPARGWEEGKCIVFDDSFEHEVFYEEAGPHEAYPGDRIVLLLNFWHPDFEFKNDPQWRQKSDEALGSMEIESLPQTALMKAAPPVAVP